MSHKKLWPLSLISGVDLPVEVPDVDCDDSLYGDETLI